MKTEIRKKRFKKEEEEKIHFVKTKRKTKNQHPKKPFKLAVYLEGKRKQIQKVFSFFSFL